jgi:hypothetical protein
VAEKPPPCRFDCHTGVRQQTQVQVDEQATLRSSGLPQRSTPTALYREQYFDLNVRHFHEKLSEEHGIGLSYTWVKQALQGAGLVKRKSKRGVHRKRRERRPLPGMMLHIDGSHHQWFQDECWYDLIVILDDASPLLVHLSLGDSMVRSFYTPQQAHARQAARWREQLVPVQFWREPSKQMVVCWHPKSAEARI